MKKFIYILTIFSLSFASFGICSQEKPKSNKESKYKSETHKEKTSSNLQRNDSILLEAIVGNNMDLFEQALEKGANLDCVDELGNTPLIWAAKYNRTKMVLKLLELGAFASPINKYGDSALKWGAIRRNEAVMQAITNHAVLNEDPCYPYVKSFDEQSQKLMNAVISNNLDAFNEALRNGANVNYHISKDKKGYPILAQIAEHGRDDMLKRILLCEELDVNQTNKGYAALDYAVINNHPTTVHLLLNTKNIKLTSTGPLRCALDNAKKLPNNASVKKIIEWLLSSNTPSNPWNAYRLYQYFKESNNTIFNEYITRNSDYCINLLYASILENNLEACDFALQFPIAPEKSEDTILFASRVRINNDKKYIQIIQRLLTLQGPNINAQEYERYADYSGLSNTPLINMVRNENLEAVKLLLTAPSIDVNRKGMSGNTALLVAAKTWQAEIIKILLAAGADYTITNDNNESYLTLAAQDKELQNLLDTYIKKQTSILAQELVQLTALPKELIRLTEESFLPTKDNEIQGKIHAAIKRGDIKALKKLISDLPDNPEEDDALDHLQRQGELISVNGKLICKDEEKVETLELSDDAGYTPLLLAAYYSNTLSLYRATAMMEWLIQQGANIHAKTIAGKKAVDLVDDPRLKILLEDHAKKIQER